jgi:diphosphomevalonate decarboxylase
MNEYAAAKVRSSPSLALIKYWGKKPGGHNLPATTSIALTLAGLDTRTELCALPPGAPDQVRLGGADQPPERFAPFFAEARRLFGTGLSFSASSENSFPSSAGLASSSSGFAALALGCAGIAGLAAGPRRDALASEAARLGSASAARALYGGFTLLPAGARKAEALYGPEYWPELRILVALTSAAPKEDSSRGAMERTRISSPYYRAWLKDSKALSREALIALASRDQERLGELMRLSYLRMHASAMAADPPALYWLPASMAVIRSCAALRARGIGAWETMDAGPQVKILCVAGDLETIKSALLEAWPSLGLLETRAGPAPDLELAEGTGQP